MTVDARWIRAGARAAAIAVGGVLGYLVGGRPGILAAFAGQIPLVLWQVVTDRHNKNKGLPSEFSGAVDGSSGGHR